MLTLPPTSHLEELSIGGNQIGGTLPANLGNSTALTRLSMFRNELEGSIPNSIVMLSNLRELNIHGSNFAESTIPNDIGALSKLETLDLAGTRVKGTVPQSIFSLSNLEHLDIQNNELTGGLPDSLARLTSLGKCEPVSIVSFSPFGSNIWMQIGLLSAEIL